MPRNPRPPGRPTKLTPETRDRILNAIKAGLTKEVAAESAGVSKTAFYEWQATNQEFADAVTRATAESETALVARIARASQDPRYWQAAVALLERRFPDRWARTDRLQVQGEVRAEVTLAGLRDALAASKKRRAVPPATEATDPA